MIIASVRPSFPVLVVFTLCATMGTYGHLWALADINRWYCTRVPNSLCLQALLQALRFVVQRRSLRCFPRVKQVALC